jgi:hypothetical protein
VLWTSNLALLELAKPDQVGLSLGARDRSSCDERRLQDGASTSVLSELDSSLRTGEALDLGDVHPVDGSGRCHLGDTPAFAEAADAAGPSTLAYLAFTSDKMQSSTCGDERWGSRGRAKRNGNVLDAHSDVIESCQGKDEAA